MSPNVTNTKLIGNYYETIVWELLIACKPCGITGNPPFSQIGTRSAQIQFLEKIIALVIDDDE
ncbi:MAG: hypothetical protein Q8O63_10505, partial [Hoeflea sp.]|nr:hypothetical protein [Hoeflea sp.]